jgi:transcriptional regulator with XRE-family HTH domain
MFWNNFVELCKKNNVTPNGLAKQLSISSGSITSWKQGRVPKWQTLTMLAEHFGVTVEELIADEKVSPPGELPQGLDEKTTEVVMKLNRLSDEQKAKVLSFLEYLAFQENQGTQ